MTQAFTFLEKRFMAGAQFNRERQGVSGAALSFGRSAQTKNEVQVDLTHPVTERLEVKIAYQLEDIDNFQGSTGVDTRNHIGTLQGTLQF